jgi:hypothetical protein
MEYKRTAADDIVFADKLYLAKTDYVVLKLFEAMMSSDETVFATLKTHYADVIEKRRAAREEIDKFSNK